MFIHDTMNVAARDHLLAAGIEPQASPRSSREEANQEANSMIRLGLAGYAYCRPSGDLMTPDAGQSRQPGSAGRGCKTTPRRSTRPALPLVNVHQSEVAILSAAAIRAASDNGAARRQHPA
jgi:hypothetical protein